jgi:uncharacterized DUF497 family protein
MDVYFMLRGEQFVWDSDKERDNIRVHDGITFARASEVFFDPLRQYQDASQHGEERDAVVGFDFSQRALFVVHVMREAGNVTRIISARKAKERDFHE